LAKSKATQLDNKSAPSQDRKRDPGILCKILSYLGGGGVQHTLVLESLVGRNPTYLVVLGPPDPDQTRQRGL
jgi:hypothetical protein